MAANRPFKPILRQLTIAIKARIMLTVPNAQEGFPDVAYFCRPLLELR